MKTSVKSEYFCAVFFNTKETRSLVLELVILDSKSKEDRSLSYQIVFI